MRLKELIRDDNDREENIVNVSDFFNGKEREMRLPVCH